MSAPRDDRPIWFGVAAYLGTFLFIPLWDLFALIFTLLTGWRARQKASGQPQEQAALAVLLQPVRRIAFLLIAYALAIFGVAAFRGVIPQPGPFGFLATGVRNYADLAAGQACCDVSNVIAPNRTVAEMLADRIPNTLRLLAGISVAGLVLVSLLLAVALLVHRLGRRKEGLGAILYSLLRLGAVRTMAVPTAGLSLILILFLALRFRLFPFGGAESARVAGGLLLDRIHHLILPSLAGALLPSLIAAQAGARAWVDWEEQYGGDRAGRWALLGTEAARAFYEQAGWILGLTMLLETIFAYPGVGSMLLTSIQRQDAPVLVGVLALFPLWLLVARLRAAITGSAQRAWLFVQPAPKPIKTTAARQVAESLVRPRRIEQIWLGVALVLLLFPLISVVRSAVASPHNPAQGSPQDAYQGPSDEHRLGTDQLGRDVESRVLQARRVTIGVALAGGLVALVIGGLWGAASVLLNRWRGPLGETLADFIRIPAEAAILLHPSLLVLAFTVSIYSVTRSQFGDQSLAMIGWALGAVLVPRLAWAVESLWNAAPPERSLRWRLGATMLVIFTASMFVAYQYSVAVDFIGLGIQPPLASLGNMLSNYQEILGGTALADPLPFYLLAARYGAAAGVPAMALYILQDVLTDFFGFRRKEFLPRVLG